MRWLFSFCLLCTPAGCAWIGPQELADQLDADGDGYESSQWEGEDCDDSDPEIHPEASERCDGRDEDCDGHIDNVAEGEGQPRYADADGDGHGDPEDVLWSCAPVDGRVATGEDCDDGDAAVHPGAEEACSGRDEDCDGLVDAEDPGLPPTRYYADADGDGYGDPDSGQDLATCTAPSGQVLDATDCDDADPAVNPGAVEQCNGIDDDCDDQVDDADEDADFPTTSWYADEDGDGWGDEELAISEASCEPPSGYVAASGDCDDSDPAVHPGASEVCSGRDEDCDDLVDAADPDLPESSWYADADGDGYGDPSDVSTTADCEAPSGRVADGSDCDDASASVHPGATEVCNDGRDDDCDGLADEDDPDTDIPTWYADADGDGFGDASAALESCAPPFAHVADDRDCDDGDAGVHPDALETCDGVDEDCDGTADEDAIDMSLWYLDSDGDGFGDEDETWTSCSPPSGYVASPGDCDDGDPAIYPDAPEDCAAVVDMNCDDSVPDTDLDGDGYRSCEECDDSDPAVFPGATERCNGVDDDCDELVDDDDPSTDPADFVDIWEDADGDGYGDEALGPMEACAPSSGQVDRGGDCDDADPAISPAAQEICGDGLDGDCSGDPEDCSLLLSDVAYAISPSTVSDALGSSLAAPGDVQGDGLADLYAGAPGADTVWLLSGPLRTDGSVASLGSPTTGFSELGLRVVPIGDTHADGAPDALAASPSAGRALLLPGDPGGGAPVATELEGSGDAFGSGLAGGNLDGNAWSDIALGAPEENGPLGGLVEPDEGAVYRFDGPLSAASLGLADADARIDSTRSRELYGLAIAMGDLDGDGLDELIASGDQGDVHVHAPWSGTVDLGDARWVLSGDADDRPGAALATGDVDGDGRSDLLLGAPGRSGGAYLVLGGLAGDLSLSDATAVLSGGGYSEGEAVALRDVDGDARADLIIGAPGDDAVHLVPAWQASGSHALEALGVVLQGPVGSATGAAVEALDSDGDGGTELAIGAPSGGSSLYLLQLFDPP